MSTHDEGQPDAAMAEKYFHSRGAAAFAEGRFDSAIRFFRKALAIEDLPYVRCHLGLAYLGKKDLGRAVVEMSKAIALAPSVAEYHYRRSVLWRLKGDHGRADEDLHAACRLNGNYTRIERIRKAAGTLMKAFDRRTAESGRLDRTRVQDEALKRVLAETDAIAEARWAAVEDRSCIVECPAYCCHFKGEPVLHGLVVGPWKLQAIRRFFQTKGLREEEFLGRLPYGPATERLRLILPHAVVKEKGERVVFYPKCTDRGLAAALVPGLPMSIEYGELAWITEEARACAFLDHGKCLVHDLGGEPALPACKEFLCLTGYVFLVLQWLKLAPPDRVSAESMRELNRIALEALLVLSDRLFGNEPLCHMEEEMDHALSQAIEADGERKKALAAEQIGLYYRLRAEYERLFSSQKRLLKKDLAAIL